MPPHPGKPHPGCHLPLATVLDWQAHAYELNFNEMLTISDGMQANRPLRELREVAKGITKQLPEPVQDASAKIDEYARGMIAGKRSTLFEELGLYYIGPVDGHNLTGMSHRCHLTCQVHMI